jgi:V8-like Glu-specific endopeptidase
MKLVASALLFLTLVSPAVSSVPTSTVTKQHNATHHIEMNTAVEGDSCSATAVGPHALLTAGHCLLATDEINVDGHDLIIEGVMFDHADHIIVIVNTTFNDYLSVEQREPLKDEVVHIWGNPGDSEDVFRIGFYWKTDGRFHRYILPVFPGDSGSGVISETGAVIDVVTTGDQSAHAGCIPLQFTPEQIENAKKQ